VRIRIAKKMHVQLHMVWFAATLSLWCHCLA